MATPTIRNPIGPGTLIATATKAATATGSRAPANGGAYASPVLADGRLYYFDRWGSALVLAAKPEFEQLAVNRIEGDRTRFGGSPAVDGNRLLLRSGKYLYCLGK